MHVQICETKTQLFMEDSLLIYLNNRLSQKQLSVSREDVLPGPVITISREVGCAGLKLARKLADHLNQTAGAKCWKVFSKEIFEETARELEMDHQKLKKILSSNERNTFDEILAALGDKRFKSELRIRKTVMDAMRTIAADGYCVIVGRGGHLITRDIEKSLHVRFVAPLAWRVEKIAQRHGFSPAEARIFIDKTEKERESVRNNIRPKGVADVPYDLEINVSVFKSSEVIALIEKAMLLRKLPVVCLLHSRIIAEKK